MALFAVNTGCSEQEVCQLRWEWEVPVAELQTSVFAIPAEFGGRSERSGVKHRKDRVVALKAPWFIGVGRVQPVHFINNLHRHRPSHLFRTARH